ncbi:hypothetical protein [Nonomuraea sp. GTA35]|uniref:hypothetical protein n=1 Tax=Nonomuraea sp. GTA35 TaxID=1676746 RepID=UPI0035C1E42E
MSGRDRSVARWFALPYVTGLLIMTLVFLTIALPLAISLGQWARDRLATAHWHWLAGALAAVRLSLDRWSTPAIIGATVC